MKSFFGTSDDIGLTILRVGSGLAMLPFGLMKLGLIGDGSFSATLQGMTGMGLPWIIALLVVIGESVGALSIILGFCTRFCAGSLAVIMAGAVFFTFDKGYMGGYMGPLLLLVMYVPQIINGGGAWSVDRMIAKSKA